MFSIYPISKRWVFNSYDSLWDAHCFECWIFKPVLGILSPSNETLSTTRSPLTSRSLPSLPTHISKLPTNSTNNSTATYYGSNDLGDLVPCIGPTPPPGLTFPIETVVSNVFHFSGPTTVTSYEFIHDGSFRPTTRTYSEATTSFTTYTRQRVPQLNPYMGNQRPCCGMCTVYFSLIDLFYWPEPGANTACLAAKATAGSSSISSPAELLPSNYTFTTAVDPDGFT